MTSSNDRSLVLVGCSGMAGPAGDVVGGESGPVAAAALQAATASPVGSDVPLYAASITGKRGLSAAAGVCSSESGLTGGDTGCGSDVRPSATMPETNSS